MENLLSIRDYIFKKFDSIKEKDKNSILSASDYRQEMYNDYKEFINIFYKDEIVDEDYKESYKRYIRLIYKEWCSLHGEDSSSIVPSRLPSPKERLKHNSDGSIDVAYNASEIRTIEQLTEFAGIDLCDKKWEIKYQDVNTYGNSNNPHYQVKARIVPVNSNKLDFTDLKEDIINTIKNYKPKPYKIKYSASKNKDLLYELAIFDHHFGQIFREGGKEVYNIDIARELMLNATNYLLEREKNNLNNIKKFVFPVGQDFYNVDNAFYTTHAGTRQDEYPAWKYTFIEGRKLIIEVIELLKQIAPVDVIITPGNHDKTKVFYLGDVLEAWYKDDKNVSVNNNIDNPRKYYNFGLNLIGFTHNDKEREKDLPILMATEEPILWSKTKFREWHSGHLHHSRTSQIKVSNELQGVKLRTIPTLCTKNEWSKEKGYLDIRESIGFLWHYDAGKIAENYFHV